MPTNRRTRLHDRRPKLRGQVDGWMLHELRTGRYLLPGTASNGDTELLRQAWVVVRDWLLNEFIRDEPGRRPFAWWVCDAPEPRRTTRFWDGLSNECRAGHYRHGIVYTSTIPPMQESQEMYLARLNLLTPAEVDHLDAKRREREQHIADKGTDCRCYTCARERVCQKWYQH